MTRRIVHDQKLASRLIAELHRSDEAAKRALVMQHQPDQYGNVMPKAQVKRMMTAGKILDLEKEVSRLAQDNRDLQSRADKCVPAGLPAQRCTCMQHRSERLC